MDLSTLKIAGDENTSDRLKQAIKQAKQSLSLKPDLPPPLIVSNQSYCSIIVEEKAIGTPNDVYIIIQKGDGTPLLNIPKTSYRYLYLSNLKHCHIFIKCKLLRLMVDRCENIQVCIRSPMLGPVEFFESLNCDVEIKFSQQGEIPVFCVEKCNNFRICQSIESIVYAIKCSSSITGFIGGLKWASYDMGKLIWGEQERQMICLSLSRGMIRVNDEYCLNNLSHHFFALPKDKDMDIFGTTPPH